VLVPSAQCQLAGFTSGGTENHRFRLGQNIVPGTTMRTDDFISGFVLVNTAGGKTSKL